MEDKRKSEKLRLFKVGEPLLNKNVCEMIHYAKSADVAEKIEITTNGSMLNPELNQKLIDAGLDILNISVNGINEAQYKKSVITKCPLMNIYPISEIFMKEKQINAD